MTKAATIRVPVLLGPTATGKTDLALRIASDLEMEIISCDSRQIYRGMDIGTAKPRVDQLNRIRHWMVDIVDPNEKFSCYQFSRDAAALLRHRAAMGKRILICGGAGLYFKSLSNGLGPEVGPHPDIRGEYWEMARLRGARSVFDELARLDPRTAAGSHPSNVKRNIRALEVFRATGTALSELKKQAHPPDGIEFFVMVCAMPRESLYQRINRRVDSMAKEGLWDEFSKLREKGFNASSPGMLCVGYRELFGVENGEIDFREALEKIKKNTRNYAKRQITWFRRQVQGLEVDMQHDPFPDVKKRIKEFIKIL